MKAPMFTPVALLVGFLAAAVPAQAGDLTLPFDSQSYHVINSWFDHTKPLLRNDDDPTMTRYDGGTGYCYNGHNGIDFYVPSGTPVLAAGPGTVVLATWNECAGWYQRVYHSALGYSTLYLHLQANFIVTSGPVARKQPISYSDNTGSCTSGQHLHFAARNGETGQDSLDPYGWSGSGNDPGAPGQSYGHLFQIRIGILTGGQLKAKDGTMSAPWQNLDSGTSALAIAEARIGSLRPNGDAWVKDGQPDAGWTLVSSATSVLSLDGRRIAIINSSGTGYAKEGDLNAAWVLLGSGIAEVVASDNPGCPKRVGMRVENFFLVSEGALGVAPVTVANDAQSIALGPCRMGYISTSGTVWVKEGLYDGWGNAQATGASFLGLGGAGGNKRIGVVVNGVAYAKEGPLDAGWTVLGSNITRVRVNSGRAGVLMTSGEAKTKEGSLSAPWVSHGTGMSDIQLN